MTIRSLLLACTSSLAAACLAAEPICQLPQPHYQPEASDPAWLVYTGQFHGHLGPLVTAGARFGMAALRAAEAKGYFDVEVACEGPFAKPPQSCFLDGLQVGTGATLGKRTLTWVEAERILVRVKNTRNGKAAELRPTPALLGLLASLKASSGAAADEQVQDAAGRDRAPGPAEALARKIAAMPERELLTVAVSHRR